MPGVLDGVTIIEMAGIGPGPFAAMMLADHGARVIRVERPGAPQMRDILNRSREIVTADLKSGEGVAKVRELACDADGLIEGFRPGVMERLGLGPDILHSNNPALVYGRMTGWGQTGPYAPFAGHDINYIALSGALHGYGRAGQKPTPPINAVGDFGGGGMMMAFGMVAGILSARQTGKGQVIDCAMTDGSAILSAMTYTFLANGQWRDERGVNLLDTGAHFYDSYETADGKYVSIGAIEAQFYAELRARAGLAEDADFDPQMNPAEWPKLKEKLATIFKSKTRDEWCELLEHSDACFAPVLSLTEAPDHPHNAARQTYIAVDGMVQPAPAPRFSETPAPKPRMG
ncbi:MAG: CaiB/BaiF CoA-transferase family protein [Pseudomonadota bacterium]